MCIEDDDNESKGRTRNYHEFASRLKKAAGLNELKTSAGVVWYPFVLIEKGSNEYEEDR